MVFCRALAESMGLSLETSALPVASVHPLYPPPSYDYEEDEQLRMVLELSQNEEKEKERQRKFEEEELERILQLSLTDK